MFSCTHAQFHDYYTQAASHNHLLTLLLGCVCVVRAPEIYSLSKFPVFRMVLLTVVITLYLSYLHVLIF